MKITANRLEQIIKEEIEKVLQEDEVASSFKRIIDLPVVGKAVAALKKGLSATGKPGSPARKAEILTILNGVGLNLVDVKNALGLAKTKQ